MAKQTELELTAQQAAQPEETPAKKTAAKKTAAKKPAAKKTTAKKAADGEEKPAAKTAGCMEQLFRNIWAPRLSFDGLRRFINHIKLPITTNLPNHHRFM